MVYQDLYNEYTSLIRDKAECQKKLILLKDGYISNKTISGKKYAYLQYRINGKLHSEYIKDEYISEVRSELDKRLVINSRINEVDERLEKIEAAAAILDINLRRELIMLRRCAAMEAMPFKEREKSLAFSSAMNALEGIHSSEKTENDLLSWAVGDYSFLESYLNTLRVYNLTKV